MLAAVLVLLVYQAAVSDSRSRPDRSGPPKGGPPVTAGARLDFVATAYCKGETTSSGVGVQAGIAAADPDLLPEGSVVRVDDVPEPYRGIYTVMDTGPKVQGRHLDIYIWSCYQALDFGRRTATVTVLRLGWSPKNSARGIR